MKIVESSVVLIISATDDILCRSSHEKMMLENSSSDFLSFTGQWVSNDNTDNNSLDTLRVFLSIIYFLF